MIKVLQYNENHCKIARDNLLTNVITKQIDITFIVDKNNSNYVTKTYKKYINNKLMIINKSGIVLDLICIHNNLNIIATKLDDITIVFTYIPLNKGDLLYFQFLNNYLRNNNCTKFVVLRDLNSRNILWEKTNDSREIKLLSIIQYFNLSVLNTKNFFTFEKNNKNSVIDLTLVTNNTLSRSSNWKVGNELYFSDHKYIYFQINSTKIQRTNEYIKVTDYSKIYYNWTKFIELVDLNVTCNNVQEIDKWINKFETYVNRVMQNSYIYI